MTIRQLLDMLDGNGMIVTDEEEIERALRRRGLDPDDEIVDEGPLAEMGRAERTDDEED